MNEKITLRRAAKIRNRLTERLAELNGKLNTHTVAVNVYMPDIDGILIEQANTFNQTFSRYVSVSKTLTTLRKAIDAKNAEFRVNNRLADSVALLGRLRVMKRIAAIDTARFTKDELTARVNGHLERLKVSEYTQDSLPLSFISQDMIDSAKVEVRDIQAQLDTIQEELESINSTQKIELGEFELAVLQQEQLI